MKTRKQISGERTRLACPARRPRRAHRTSLCVSPSKVFGEAPKTAREARALPKQLATGRVRPLADEATTSICSHDPAWRAVAGRRRLGRPDFKPCTRADLAGQADGYRPSRLPKARNLLGLG